MALLDDACNDQGDSMPMRDYRSPAESTSTEAGGETSGLALRAAVEAAVARFQSRTDREESFRWLYQTYFPAIERFFARKGIPPEDCLDLTQETFLGIYRGLDVFRSDARFETWLYRVATSTYLKSLRTGATAKRKGRSVPLDDGLASEAALGSPADQLEGVIEDERAQAMAAAVRRLPDQMRKCLTFRLYQQLAYREIAEVMKLNIETVKVHLFKARKRLKEDLHEYTLEELDAETETTGC